MLFDPTSEVTVTRLEKPRGIIPRNRPSEAARQGAEDEMVSSRHHSHTFLIGRVSRTGIVSRFVTCFAKRLSELIDAVRRCIDARLRTLLREGTSGTDLAPFLVEDASSRDLVYVVFGAPSDGMIDCQRCGSHPGFGSDDPLRMEISSEWKTENLGTASTSKAVWVRYLNADLGGFRIQHLTGPAVVGAFRSGDVVPGNYAVLSRRNDGRRSTLAQPKLGRALAVPTHTRLGRSRLCRNFRKSKELVSGYSLNPTSNGGCRAALRALSNTSRLCWARSAPKFSTRPTSAFDAFR